MFYYETIDNIVVYKDTRYFVCLHISHVIAIACRRGGTMQYPEQGTSRTSLLSETLAGSRLSLAMQEASQTGSQVNLTSDTHVPKT